MKAADIMTTEVVTVGPETDVSEVTRLLLAHRISAEPVVNGTGQVMGMVSEADLMRRAKCGRSGLRWLSLFTDKTAEFVRTHGTRVRDVMTCEVVSIGKDATLSEIASLLERRAIKRAPVIENGRLVGIVGRSDVLRGLASLGTAVNAHDDACDLAIRQNILELVKQHSSASLQAVTVIVDGGKVYLWGIVESEEERNAVRVAADTVVGTGKVIDNLNTLPQVLEAV
jgi:CBS-domain-containing membrane protein